MPWPPQPCHGSKAGKVKVTKASAPYIPFERRQVSHVPRPKVLAMAARAGSAAPPRHSSQSVLHAKVVLRWRWCAAWCHSQRPRTAQVAQRWQAGDSGRHLRKRSSIEAAVCFVTFRIDPNVEGGHQNQARQPPVLSGGPGLFGHCLSRGRLMRLERAPTCCSSAAVDTPSSRPTSSSF